MARETIQELLTMPCPACGASLPIRPESATGRCDYCSTEFATPAGLRERAAAYLSRIRAAWADEIEARLIQTMHASAAKSNPGTLRWLLVLALAAPFWIIMLGSGAVEIFSPYLIAACVALTLISGWRVISGITGPSRPPSVALVVASGLGACRICGGPVPVEEGETACRCRFCGATSVPTPEQKREMLRAALQRVAPAQLESVDAFRENVRSASEAKAVFGVFGKRSAAAVMTVILIAGAFALTGFTIYIVFTVDRPDVQRYEAGWVGPTLMIGFAAIVAHAVIKVRRLNRAKAQFEKIMGRPIRPLMLRA